MSATICPDCRMPIWPSVDHECGHNEWRFIVCREGLPTFTVHTTTNVHELPALARSIAKLYRDEPEARIICQRRWVDGWSVVDDPAVAAAEHITTEGETTP